MLDAKLLIVEDEFLVALQLEDILTDAGYEVIGIVADMASLSAIRSAPALALVDVNLRDGPTGTIIAQRLSERFGTRILYVTATPQQITNPAPTTVGVVQKPFLPSAVLAAVQEGLAGPVQTSPLSQIRPRLQAR